MRVCGVELRENEANLCFLVLDGDVFDIPDCRQRKFTLSDYRSSEALREFQFAFSKLLQDYKIEQVVIRERETRGKWAGSAVSFKLEAAIQLIDSVPIELIAPVAIKEQLKCSPLLIDFRETGLKPFQQDAFMTAFAYLNRRNNLG